MSLWGSHNHYLGEKETPCLVSTIHPTSSSYRLLATYHFFLYAFYSLFKDIFIYLVLLKGSGFRALETEVFYLSTKQAQHGKQL